MRNNAFPLFIALLLALPSASAQETFPFNGVRPKEVTSMAFTNATIWVDADQRIEGATLIVEKGKVKAVGKSIAIPKDAVVTDLEGKWIYPSFIDLYSDYGLPKVTPAERGSGRRVQSESDRKGAFGWNQAIRSDVRANQLFEPMPDAAGEYRAAGFGVLLTHSMDGIARGTGALVTAGNQVNKNLLIPDAAVWDSFSKGSSTQDYPSSLMGSVALLRQTYYDAAWYAAGGRDTERNLSLEAWLEIQKLPKFFDAGDKWQILRADRIGDEFGVQYVFKGGGNEYQRIQELKETRGAVIIPLDFPDPWNVSDPFNARLVSLAEMKHWELAPYNAIRLHEAGITMAFTSRGLADKKQFLPALRKVHETGLSESEILRALTLTPAKLVRADREVGTLRAGSWANFFISSGSLLDAETVIYDHFIQGDLHAVNPKPDQLLNGSYSLVLEGQAGQLSVIGEPGSYRSVWKAILPIQGEQEPDDKPARADTLQRKVLIQQFGSQITLVVEPDSAHRFLQIRMSGVVTEEGWRGHGQNSEGKWFEWSAAKEKSEESAARKDKKIKEKELPGPVNFPFGAYGWTTKPTAETTHIIHATLWTNEWEGVIEDGEILLHSGKIIAVGKKVNASGYSNVKVIDAQGKHVTPGIIDEHSHIALVSVNEGAQASSAEVEESRVVDPEDVNIYRQLSGGVTAAQLLHGSANPIGGQSALIKLRWGLSDREMLIDKADGFIKFALGENVKQSNWGEMFRARYPQTRMGVEQVYYDHFIRAREYGETWRTWNASQNAKGKKGSFSGIPPRRDLELECLLEILEKKRFVTCHSYQQGEINMLMHVADSMGFRINTFTHILEGYKVADKMRAHGVGGSSFSDWWAYKMEVKDAIPHNGALLWENGIVVAFNSDDAEMGRRLNQEAAKAVKYGNVPEEEALKFVTLNPAKLLHLDHRMGSLKVGKDADIVIWSDHPLSIYARAEKTYVDGVCYYDAEREAETLSAQEAERSRLIAKMLVAKASSASVREPAMKSRKHFHCDSLGDR